MPQPSHFKITFISQNPSELQAVITFWDWQKALSSNPRISETHCNSVGSQQPQCTTTAYATATIQWIFPIYFQILSEKKQSNLHSGNLFIDHIHDILETGEFYQLICMNLPKNWATTATREGKCWSSCQAGARRATNPKLPAKGWNWLDQWFLLVSASCWKVTVKPARFLATCLLAFVSQSGNLVPKEALCTGSL